MNTSLLSILDTLYAIVDIFSEHWSALYILQNSYRYLIVLAAN